VIGPAALLVAAVAAMIAALAFGGGANAPLLADPGALVRWGLPAATLVVNLSLAGTVGALVLACFAFSPDRDEYGNALDFAAGSAAVMTVASAATGLFTFVSVSNVPWSFDATFSNGLSSFITSVSLGQAWLGITLIAAAVTVLCFAVRNQTAIVFVTLLAIATVVPMAQQGHSAEAAGHDAAVTSFGLHVLFAAIWLGGLVTLIVVKQRLGNGRLVTVLERYSTVALICFVVVAASGYVNAELRVGTLAELATPYGILVLVKVAALVVLGLFGLTQRRYLIGRLKQSGEPRSFWWIVVAELAFMGIASGVAQRSPARSRPSRRRVRPPRRPPRSSPERSCLPLSPGTGCSPRGTSTCCGCWPAPSACSSTSPASGGRASAATRGRSTARCSGRWASSSCSTSPMAASTSTRSTCSRPTCRRTWC